MKLKYLKKLSCLHPFLFVLLPPLILFAENIRELIVTDTLRTFAVIEAGTALVFIIARIIFRSTQKAGLFTLLCAIVFFSYFHLGQVLPELYIPITESFIIGKHKLLMPIVFLLAAYLSYRLYISRQRYYKFSAYLILIFLLLIGVNILGLVENLPRKIRSTKTVRTGTTLSTGSQFDVYYIILDGYGRKDVLKEYFNFDNSDFVNFLRSQGFYVPKKTQTNYIQTFLSLASTLNMDYIPPLLEKQGPAIGDAALLRPLIVNNRVTQTFKKYGYDFVSFASGYEPSENNPNADIYCYQHGSLNYFEYRMLNNTLLRRLGVMLKLDLSKVARNRFYFNQEKLREVPLMPQPTFTFMHILQPHPPFIFGPEGEVTNKGKVFSLNDGSSFKGTIDEYRQGYINQLRFVNANMRSLIPNLITNSEEPPIIILQSDHGPGSMTNWNDGVKTNHHERMGNFLAVYAPSVIKNKLYETISPVNLFRVVLTELTPEDLPLLEDHSYYSSGPEPFNFYEVIDGVFQYH